MKGKKMQDRRNEIYEDYCISSTDKWTSEMYQQRNKEILIKIYISSEQLNRISDNVGIYIKY